MDCFCSCCAEPWDMDYVLHEAPEEFERSEGTILHCPTCPDIAPRLSESQKTRTSMAAALGDILGDDIDGIGAEMEDLEALGVFREQL